MAVSNLSDDQRGVTAAPLTPKDCDLRGLEWMPLYGGRLFGSDFDAHATDAEWRAALQLWWAAWNQVPAASLPDDDVALCRLAGFGRDVKGWEKVKARALHGFVQCSDGRLYHKALAVFACESWERRLKDRERKAKWREERERKKDGDGTRTKTVTRRGQDADGDVPATTDEMRRDEMRRDATLVNDSVSNDTGGADAAKVVFRQGLAWLVKESGRSESECRSLLGKARKDVGDEALIAILGAAQRHGPIDAVEYLTKAVAQRKSGPNRKPWDKPQTDGMPTEEPWDARMKGWREKRFWVASTWGPPPGEHGCRVPPALRGDA